MPAGLAGDRGDDRPGDGPRGHDPFSWGLLGGVLGPLVLPLAISAARRPRVVGPQQLAAGGRSSGRVDVLVGIDGSPQAAALDAAVALLGPRLGRLTLAVVTTLDATVARQQEEARLCRELRRQAGRIQPRLAAAGVQAAADLVLLRGQPAEVLTTYALAGAYGLLAVGTRGAGLTHRLLGSVAESLAAGCRVPVLLTGGAGTARQATPTRWPRCRPVTASRTGQAGELSDAATPPHPDVPTNAAREPT